MELRVASVVNFGRITQASGTAITRLVPPRENLYTRIARLLYVCAGTAHTVTLLRAMGSTTLSHAAAGAQAVIRLTAQPVSGNNIAANDLLVVQNNDGTVFLGTVSSVNGLDITLAANLAAAISAGAKVWMMGVAGDTDPNTGYAHPALLVTASTNNLYESEVGIVGSNFKNEPLLVHSNNATAAGSIEALDAVYTSV